MTRRDYLALSTAAALTGCRLNPQFPVEEAGFETLQQALRAGTTTAEALTLTYLDRIQSLDTMTRSVIETNPEALSIARQLDRDRQQGRPLGPLHGLPILLKDNIDTGDRMLTTAGSLALEAAPAPLDAPLVQRLRQAGAVILGKTNLSEWANFRSTRSISGWSGRGGQTHNAYVLNRNASGSSSGSGVAVSASFCAAAIGSETDGSIVSPSSLSGIVGFKPTLGWVSGKGIIPIAHSQDTAGPMARSVHDAVVLMNVLREPRAGAGPIDLTALRPDALKGARIGVARQFFGEHPGVKTVAEAALDAIKKLGATTIDIQMPSFKQIGDAEGLVLIHEIKADMAAYLATRKGLPHRTLADLIKFNESNARREMPYFGQELFLQAEATKGLDAPEYQKALADSKRLSRAEGIDKAMAEHQLDAIFAPTDGPAWAIDWATGDHYGNSCSTPAAVAGYPHITVPAGFYLGLPLGISFFGAAWSEQKLAGYAYAFEQATRARRKPMFLPTLES